MAFSSATFSAMNSVASRPVAGPRCAAQVSKLSASSLQGQRLCSGASLSLRRSSHKISTVIRANVVTDIGKYLGEAAAQIFSSTKSDVDWEGTATPFSGAISHHNEVDRLRVLYSVVQGAKQQIAGCTNPDAANFNPNATADDGTCAFVVKTNGQEVVYESLGDYMSTAVEKVMKSNFKGSETEPDWANTTYNYKGDIVSQRDISRLLAFEKTVKKALDKAEADAKNTK